MIAGELRRAVDDAIVGITCASGAEAYDSQRIRGFRIGIGGGAAGAGDDVARRIGARGGVVEAALFGSGERIVGRRRRGVGLDRDDEIVLAGQRAVAGLRSDREGRIGGVVGDLAGIE